MAIVLIWTLDRDLKQHYESFMSELIDHDHFISRYMLKWIIITRQIKMCLSTAYNPFDRMPWLKYLDDHPVNSLWNNVRWNYNFLCSITMISSVQNTLRGMEFVLLVTSYLDKSTFKIFFYSRSVSYSLANGEWMNVTIHYSGRVVSNPKLPQALKVFWHALNRNFCDEVLLF